MVESTTFEIYYKSNVRTKTLQNIFYLKLKFNKIDVAVGLLLELFKIFSN